MYIYVLTSLIQVFVSTQTITLRLKINDITCDRSNRYELKQYYDSNIVIASCRLFQSDGT